MSSKGQMLRRYYEWIPPNPNKPDTVLEGVWNPRDMAANLSAARSGTPTWVDVAAGEPADEKFLFEAGETT